MLQSTEGVKVMGTRKPEDIRSIALISHGGAGKTTLNEAFLFDAGLISRMGKVEDKNTVSDFDSEEQKRGISISTSLSTVPYKDKTFYILDEPTTGLHTYDVDKLIKILARLRESGNTVLIIEHNLDVIKTADWIIDLGPEGGDKGGTVIACGTPEQIAERPESYTGRFLKKVLGS